MWVGEYRYNNLICSGVYRHRGSFAAESPVSGTPRIMNREKNSLTEWLGAKRGMSEK